MQCGSLEMWPTKLIFKLSVGLLFASFYDSREPTLSAEMPGGIVLGAGVLLQCKLASLKLEARVFHSYHLLTEQWTSVYRHKRHKMELGFGQRDGEINHRAKCVFVVC